MSQESTKKSQKPEARDSELYKRPAVAWAVTASCGVLAISALGTPKLDEPGFTVLRLTVPIVIIGVYTLVGLRSVNRVKDLPVLRNARIGQLADSVYFLGFLWTLWALIDSFVIHNLSIAEAVFRAFGYALITTASGMFLRLVLLQFTYSAEDQHLLGEQHIEDEIARFTTKIKKAGNTLARFQKQMESLATEMEASGAEVNKQTAALAHTLQSSKSKVLGDLGAVKQEVLNKLHPDLKEINQSVERVQIAATDSAKDLQAHSARIVQELEEHTGNMKKELAESSEAFENATTVVANSMLKQLTSIEENLSQVSSRIAGVRISPDLVDKALTSQFSIISESLGESTKELQLAVAQLRDSVLEASNEIRVRHTPWWRRVKFWA